MTPGTPESYLEYIGELVPRDHLCRMVKEVVFSLDTEPIEAKYSFLGQNSYHPKLLLSVLFYGYATGVRSSRKLSEKCISDHMYIYLMQCYRPDYRTISDFRKNNIKEIEKYFVDIVRIFSELGYKNVGKIYLDGTKIKGSASSKRTKDRAGFEKWLEKLDEEIKNLLKEAETIDNQEDESCKLSSEQEELQKKLGNRKYVKSKIHEALEMLKDERRKKVNLTDQDANYMKSGGSKDIRPEGKRLKYWKTRKKTTKSRQWNHKVYKGTGCANCVKRSLCTKAKVRELLIDIREPLLNRMRERVLSKEGALKYFKRQYTIEPIFGHLKYNLGYKSFLLRGVEKVKAEFRLMCIGWNLKKMFKMGIMPARA